jgi:hypothetical protein
VPLPHRSNRTSGQVQGGQEVLGPACARGRLTTHALLKQAEQVGHAGAPGGLLPPFLDQRFRSSFPGMVPRNHVHRRLLRGCFVENLPRCGRGVPEHLSLLSK